MDKYVLITDRCARRDYKWNEGEPYKVLTEEEVKASKVNYFPGGVYIMSGNTFPEFNEHMLREYVHKPIRLGTHEYQFVNNQ